MLNLAHNKHWIHISYSTSNNLDSLPPGHSHVYTVDWVSTPGSWWISPQTHRSKVGVLNRSMACTQKLWFLTSSYLLLLHFVFLFGGVFPPNSLEELFCSVGASSSIGLLWKWRIVCSTLFLPWDKKVWQSITGSELGWSQEGMNGHWTLITTRKQHHKAASQGFGVSNRCAQNSRGKS